ncbi:MAG TPA: alpha/beta hydrolase-fold protein [Pseudomonadales bacterium]
MRVLLSLLLLALSGCARFQPLTTPIGQIHYHTALALPVSQRQLVVLLPGISGWPGDYARHGLVDDIQRLYPSADVVSVNAHFGYYRSRQLLARLQQDVIAPALEQGYCAVHLAGISLGGFGGLLYLREFPDQLASVSLLAPYLGEPADYGYLLNEGEQAQPASIAGLWPWLTALDDNTAGKIYLAWGRDDAFDPANSLLAAYLPAGHAYRGEGNHRWPTWQRLWRNGLEHRQLLPIYRDRCVAINAN